MQIYSRPGQGTRDHGPLRRARAPRDAPDAARRHAGAVSGRDRCAATTGRGATRRAGRTIMLVDGSGHGVEAARAAELAVRTLRSRMRMRRARTWSSGSIARWRRRAAALWRWRASTPPRAWFASSGVGNISAMLVNGGQARATWCRTTARPATSRRASASSPMTSPAIRW